MKRAAADDARVSVFLRGLSAGALVGAAVAGSAIWRHLRDAARRDVEPPAAAAKDAAP
ncbi:MAG: hypothetical protein IVW53_01525 [Chloroflexi bacterium]|nr:hypothetical protein [Chloroflexota bacterium]